MAKWKCSACGYTCDGNNPPRRCPMCKSLSEKFISLGGAKSPVSAPSKGVAQKETPPKKERRIQGVSVVSTNVVSEQEIAMAVQQAVNNEINNLNYQGKRVINVSVGSAVKNVIGMKHHIVILWEQE